VTPTTRVFKLTILSCKRDAHCVLQGAEGVQGLQAEARMDWRQGGMCHRAGGQRSECEGGTLMVSQRFPGLCDTWQHVIGPPKVVLQCNSIDYPPDCVLYWWGRWLGAFKALQ
jgi:hypothetical protein